MLWGARAPGTDPTLVRHVSRWDGEQWTELPGELGTCGVGGDSEALAFGPRGELLLATVSSDPRAPVPARTYTLEVRRWEAATGWSSLHPGAIAPEPRSYKGAPVLWDQDGAVHLAWLEETAEVGFEPSGIAFSMSHDNADPGSLRDDRTPARDVFVVRSGPDGWSDLGSSRELRRGLLPARALRYEFALGSCE